MGLTLPKKTGSEDGSPLTIIFWNFIQSAPSLFQWFPSAYKQDTCICLLTSQDCAADNLPPRVTGSRSYCPDCFGGCPEVLRDFPRSFSGCPFPYARQSFHNQHCKAWHSLVPVDTLTPLLTWKPPSVPKCSCACRTHQWKDSGWNSCSEAWIPFSSSL